MTNDFFNKTKNGINRGNMSEKMSCVESGLGNVDKGALGSVWGKVEQMHRFIWDSSVPFSQKVLPLAALLYLVTPIDMVPDIVPIAGYLDDIAVLLYAYGQMTQQ